MVITTLNKLYVLLCRLKRRCRVPICLEILDTLRHPYCTAPMLLVKINLWEEHRPKVDCMLSYHCSLRLISRGPLTSVAGQAVGGHCQAVRS
jgi:hypothetical protein